MSNEIMSRLNSYINDNNIFINNATAEDKQKAYELGMDFITNLMLSEMAIVWREDNRQKQNALRKENERIAKQSERLELCKTNINGVAGRIEWLINYLGCAVQPLDNRGNVINCMGRETNHVKQHYKAHSAVVLKINGDTFEYFAKYFILGNDETLKKLIAKHNLKEPALTIDFANGQKGCVYSREMNSIQCNCNYAIDDLIIVNQINLSAEDKLNIDIAKLDDCGMLPRISNELLTAIEDTKTSNDRIKRHIMLG